MFGCGGWGARQNLTNDSHLGLTSQMPRSSPKTPPSTQLLTMVPTKLRANQVAWKSRQRCCQPGEPDRECRGAPGARVAPNSQGFPGQHQTRLRCHSPPPAPAEAVRPPPPRVGDPLTSPPSPNSHLPQRRREWRGRRPSGEGKLPAGRGGAQAAGAREAGALRAVRGGGRAGGRRRAAPSGRAARGGRAKNSACWGGARGGRGGGRETAGPGPSPGNAGRGGPGRWQA